MRIFFSVGEPSGDLHGANLIRRLRALRPDIEVIGYGGPRMKEAGLLLHADLTRLAVMWFLSVFTQLHRFWKLYRQAKRTFRDHRPDAVVLIDYPGFNWWIASAAKKHGIPVYYYGVPQMWAWASWRIHKMRRLVDHALCKLPFEAEWYQAHGCDAKYVGHPYYDELAERVLDTEFLAELARDSRPLVTLLPGSRKQEVERTGPGLLDAAQKAYASNPNLRLAAACFNEEQKAMLAQHVADRNLPIELYVARTAELIEAAHCCLACSGSVSLELMCAAKPSAILYKVSRLQFALGRMLVKVRYMTLVNLLAMEDRFNPTPYDPSGSGERPPMPEYPTYQDRSTELARHVVQWTTDPEQYEADRQRLAALRDTLAAPGASARAAEYILDSLSESVRTVSRAA